MKTALRRAVSMLFLATAFTCAAAPSYRWTDSQGKTHFGDQPPPGASNVVQTSGAPAVAASTPPPSTTSGLSADECQRKQNQLAGYRNASTITETDALGNRRDYSDDERKKLIERTQQAINDGCPQAN